MPAPNSFTWVDPPLLAAMSQPAAVDEYAWLREQGVQLVISLCEDPPPRSWLNEAGLFSMHIPVEDMHPPTLKQIELCLQAIEKAHARRFGVAIHCGAGLGRTGTMLACYYVKKGMSAPAAIAHVRNLRPGSIETPEQADAIKDYARRHRRSDVEE
jgi:atypical dual specificity phosphatase